MYRASAKIVQKEGVPILTEEIEEHQVVAEPQLGNLSQSWKCLQRRVCVRRCSKIVASRRLEFAGPDKDRHRFNRSRRISKENGVHVDRKALIPTVVF